MKRLLLALLVAVASLLVSASVAQAAAPRIIIVSGESLKRQIVISDWGKIFQIVAEVAPARPVSRTQLANRPRLKFSMFWGPRWNEYLASGRPASALRPRQADQTGSLYPGWRGRPALIDLLPWAGRWPRPLSAKALTILKRYGVPIKLP
jgi:hypothetical protein